MCMKRECTNCHKATWWGCGKHIPSVLDTIPEEDRCSCEPKVNVDGKEYPPKQGEGKPAAAGAGAEAGAKDEL